MDLGHVGIYRGLARAANLSVEVEQQLFDALQRKAIDEVVGLTQGLPSDLAACCRPWLVCVAVTKFWLLRERLGQGSGSSAGSSGRPGGDCRRVVCAFPQLPLYFDLGGWYHYQWLV